MAQEALARGSAILDTAASTWLTQALLALTQKPVAVINPLLLLLFLNLYTLAMHKGTKN